MLRKTPHFKLTLGLLALLIGTGALLSCRSVDWFVLKRSLRAKFGDERWITTEQLADWLADKDHPAPMLLDVRTPAEWKVSHLPGARQVDPAASAEAVAGATAKSAPIVTYCSVGYRSGEMARRLRAAGFTRVRNLEGSIFEWGNEHRPLVHGGKPATQVHPYDAFWSRLLQPEVWARLPAND
ncbi:MAG TPA: rhodanese-like domain-containing protein [Chthoniobacterales bacterium]|jgi:rhodanese-related sulfurtransferase